VTTTITPRSVAVGKFPSSVPALLKFTQAFASGLTDNANFPDSAPFVAAINTAYTALNTAETAVKARTQGTVAARNVAKGNLVTALHSGKSYVQGKADANPAHGQAIIESSGLAVRKTTIRQKAVFAAKPGAVSGTVKLTAKVVARRSSYEWDWSADGGKTWTSLPATLQAKTTVVNLPVGANASFRFRAVTKEGEGDWSQIVTLLVK
jgi:hypothetical protein